MNPPGALPSWNPLIKFRYFQGSGDFQTLYEEFQKWLEDVKPSGYQLHSTSTFDPKDGVWRVLVTVMYQEREAVGQGQIAVPTFMLSRNPVA